MGALGEMVENYAVPDFRLRPTVVIVAGGPSLTLSQVRAIGMMRAADLCSVIAINDSIYPLWFADVLYACDARWWEHHGTFGNFRGYRVSVEDAGDPGIIRLEKTGFEGFDERPGKIRTGSNSGYQAVHLAAQLSATKIILVGYDFTLPGAQDHWFGRHPARMDRSSDVVANLRMFRGLTDILASRGVMVHQASPGSKINWLPAVDVETMILVRKLKGQT